MFVSPDSSSLHRGRRKAPRTEVCRPCLVWAPVSPEDRKQGVSLDLNAYGMKIRTLVSYPEGTELMVQLMRDDDFRVPLSPPIRVTVVRRRSTPEGFLDYGLQIRHAIIKSAEGGRSFRIPRPYIRRRAATRMYSVDHILDERGRRRTGRDRG